MIKRIKTENGSTLLLIAGILAVMGIVAVFLFYRAEAEWAAVKNLENYDAMQQIAEEQLQERLAVFISDDTETDSPKDPWYGGTGEVVSQKDGYRLQIRIEDEGSKPHLNLLTENGIKELLPEDLSPDPILDWGDPDDLERGNGAETPYYQGLNPPYKARNGFFASVEEMKEVKNGDRLYSVLAPEVTVYGKINPNILDQYGFLNLLKAIRYQGALDPKTIAENFGAYHANKRFDNIDSLTQVQALTDDTKKLLEPYLEFKGSCNPNFVSLKGLKALLKNAGLDAAKADAIIARRDHEPFQNINQFKGMISFPTAIKNRSLEDYFSLVSTVVRFRIWVTKGSAVYYLDTVQERTPANGKPAWKVHPLSWRVLLNKEAPQYQDTPAATVESPIPDTETPFPEPTN